MGVWNSVSTFWNLIRTGQLSGLGSGKIVLLGQLVAITPVQSFVDMQKFLEALKAEHILYTSMKTSGINYMEGVKQHYKMKKIQDMITWAAHSITISGWGKFAELKFDAEKNQTLIKILDSPFAQLYGRSKEPVDNVLRGFFAGGQTSAIGEPSDTIETQCIAKGDRLCEFLTKPTNEWLPEIRKTSLINKQLGKVYSNPKPQKQLSTTK